MLRDLSPFSLQSEFANMSEGSQGFQSLFGTDVVNSLDGFDHNLSSCVLDTTKTPKT